MSDLSEDNIVVGQEPPEMSNENSVGNGAEWPSAEQLGCISSKISAFRSIEGSAGRVWTGLFSLSNAWLTLLCCLGSRSHSPFNCDINLFAVSLKFFVYYLHLLKISRLLIVYNDCE